MAYDAALVFDPLFVHTPSSAVFSWIWDLLHGLGLDNMEGARSLGYLNFFAKGGILFFEDFVNAKTSGVGGNVDPDADGDWS